MVIRTLRPCELKIGAFVIPVATGIVCQVKTFKYPFLVTRQWSNKEKLNTQIHEWDVRKQAFRRVPVSILRMRIR